MSNDNKTVKHLDAKIADAQEDVTKAQQKLAVLLAEKANRERTENVAVGETVTFDFGRGEKRRRLTGTVIGIGDDEKQGKLLAVQTGEGIDTQTLKIRAVDVLAPEEQGDNNQTDPSA